MANASNVFRVGGEYDLNTNFWGIFDWNASTSLRVKIAFDGFSSLGFERLACCMYLSFEVKVFIWQRGGIFTRGRLRYFARLPGEWTKAVRCTSVVGDFIICTLLYLKTRGESRTFKFSKPTKDELYERIIQNRWKTKPKPTNFSIHRLSLLSISCARGYQQAACLRDHVRFLLQKTSFEGNLAVWNCLLV